MTTHLDRCESCTQLADVVADLAGRVSELLARYRTGKLDDWAHELEQEADHLVVRSVDIREGVPIRWVRTHKDDDTVCRDEECARRHEELPGVRPEVAVDLRLVLRLRGLLARAERLYTTSKLLANDTECGRWINDVRDALRERLTLGAGDVDAGSGRS